MNNNEFDRKMHTGSVSRRTRMKSISLEDLGSIVKNMINGALDDTEQMAKLHRAIYDELYFEKMTEFDGDHLKKNSSTGNSRDTIKTESIERLTGDHEEDSRSICIEEKIVNDSHSDRGDDYKIEEIVHESVSKIVGRKEAKERSQKEPDEAKIENKVSSYERADRNERAFDEWRKEKTRSMRRMLREERRKRREALEAQQAEIEKKRASHEAYLRSKKLQKTQRKLEKLQREAIKEAYLRMQEQECERTVANEEAYKAWKQHKENESRQRHRQPRRQRTQTESSRCCNDNEFDSWLDQLDSVLHQKYLRERRYLVRSFYCQPTYYGSAALSMQ